eukprot:CAMPEP_0170459454 /NCGR_PEP_ID=MMETSP0123-20130129/6138_1 /TAXON_ID=182087 /ORGANISM="Favella ehrenbergii, Strain Fehren 1" /LENGTH=47 /DNA_ID= /DNA_START= /DNA_END= /DNA_ORIENTATION=
MQREALAMLYPDALANLDHAEEQGGDTQTGLAVTREDAAEHGSGGED